MENQNSRLLDPEIGLVSVLGLISVRLNGPVRWQGEDINDELAVGSIFRAYDPDPKPGDLDIASITLVDVTKDPSEPDISTMDQAGIQAFDSLLRQNMETHLPTDGMQLVRWMSSQINESDDLKGLITAYIAKDQGKVRQFIALRVSVKGHKIVAVGVFDIARNDTLATPIINILRSIGFAP